MPRQADLPSTQEFVVAVRERHQGPGSEAALEARLELAQAYLEVDLIDEALEVLLGAVIDATRIHGPAGDRTVQARLMLASAYGTARPFDACGVYENLRVDVQAVRPPDDPLLHRVVAIADAAYEALEAEHGPLE